MSFTKTKFGKNIVFVVGYNFKEFVDFVAHKKDIIPSPAGSSGVAYSKTHNYRFVYDVSTLRGHRNAEVMFLDGAIKREDFETLVSQAEIVRRK